MIASEAEQTQVLTEPCAYQKLKRIASDIERLLKDQAVDVPTVPGRNVQILSIRELPPKPGLSTRLGQARLVHDLASIELQAMELGVRTLAEFPEAPREFREQLAKITLEEANHLGLCLKALEDLGHPWGSFPVHVGLWQAVSSEDSLLDRILIVHRYLEGSGLDASETILRRLHGVKAKEALTAVEVIRREEWGHVQFGSRWYQQLVREIGGDPGQDFADRLKRLFHRIPRRLEPINREARLQAGFLPEEISALERARQSWFEKESIHYGR